MITLRGSTLAVVLGGIVAAGAPALAQPPAQSGTSAPTDAQVRELQEQVKSLQQQLDELDATKDPASRRGIMEQNWQSMQDYMGQMHDRWGMGSPWMMGPRTKQGPGSGPGMMGCPMLGSSGMGWALPEGVDPSRYSQEMSDQMKRMHEQMNQIAQTTDPQERQRLMQDHWQTMYQGMQTMRGMGWMWGGPMMGPGMMHGGMMPKGPAPSDAPLPAPDSAGAKLLSTYCVQCHAAPQPTLHTAAEWTGVTQRMHARMGNGWAGIKTPTDQEMATIVTYLQKHARQERG